MDDRTFVLDEAICSDEVDESDSQVTRRSLMEAAVIKRIQGFANVQKRFTRKRLELGYLEPGDTLYEVW